MSKTKDQPKTKINFDLEERTLKFSEQIIKFIANIEKNVITLPLTGQLIKSATSIGANYCEANGASSKRDFKHKIYLCKKEAKETEYWLKLILKAYPRAKETCQILLQEVHELTLIFSKIIITMETKSKLLIK